MKFKALPKKYFFIFSSVFTSGINFLIFVGLPVFIGVENLESFVRSNYVGGMYLFGVASSVSIVASIIFQRAGLAGLLTYSWLSLLAFFLLGLAMHSFFEGWSSIRCMFVSFLLQVNGFILAYLIRSGCLLRVFFGQILQPGVFFLGVVVLGLWGITDWSYAYFTSSVLATAYFLISVPLSDVILELKSVNVEVFKVGSIFFPMVSGLSFPVIFQVETILVGEFSSVSLGDFVVLQKLYSSVAIAIFGAYLVYAYRLGLRESGALSYKSIMIDSVFSTAVVAVAVSVVSVFKSYSLGQMFLTVVLSYFFSFSMFVSFYMSMVAPLTNLKCILFSSIVYLLMFFGFSPGSIETVLIISVFLYLCYIAVNIFVVSPRFRKS